MKRIIGQRDVLQALSGKDELLLDTNGQRGLVSPYSPEDNGIVQRGVDSGLRLLKPYYVGAVMLDGVSVDTTRRGFYRTDAALRLVGPAKPTPTGCEWKKCMSYKLYFCPWQRQDRRLNSSSTSSSSNIQHDRRRTIPRLNMLSSQGNSTTRN